MSRSCQSATFSMAGRQRAHHARQAGEIFRQYRVALVRHRRRALLAGREASPRLRALRCAAGGGFRLPGVSDRTEPMTPRVAKIHRMAVARDDLGGDRLGGQAPWPCADVFLDARVDIGEGADGAGYGAGGDLGAGIGDQALLAIAARSRHRSQGQVEADGGRLGVDAVASGRYVTVSLCSKARTLQRCQQRGRGRRAGGRWPRTSWTLQQSCRARRTSATPLPMDETRCPDRRISARCVRKAMTSCLVIGFDFVDAQRRRRRWRRRPVRRWSWRLPWG